MNIEFLTSHSAVALVDRRPEMWPHALWVTISPNPRTLHKCIKSMSSKTSCKTKMVKIDIPYGKLPQRQQYEYCLKVIRNCYNYTSETKIFGTWELNSHGDVHFHFIMSDPSIHGPTMLKVFQRDVLNCTMVMKNLSKNMIDYMNNIVYVNDSIEKRYEYMLKDMDDNISIMPYYCVNCSKESEKSLDSSSPILK